MRKGVVAGGLLVLAVLALTAAATPLKRAAM